MKHRDLLVYALQELWLLEVNTDFSSQHLVIDIVSDEAILRISEGAGSERIKSTSLNQESKYIQKFQYNSEQKRGMKMEIHLL